ncbi:hypothetical protein M0813_28625 [Anaeramoeba flamelloides]|uniref:Uncharacterized protein n=1 Tax=Anaeramoeba flamelloides TaxID=1746091 RepID=A0ABQ8XSE3_9EUKA|nr:hypothetical protein M0813_28625 [Anaeramoeba flamelloides]
MKEIIEGMIDDYFSMEREKVGSRKHTNLTWFGSSGCGKTRMSKCIFFQQSFQNIFDKKMQSCKNSIKKEEKKLKINNLIHSFLNFKKHHLFLYNSFLQNPVTHDELREPKKSLFYRILMAISQAIQTETQITLSDCEHIDKLSEIFEPIQETIILKKKTNTNTNTYNYSYNNNNNNNIFDNNENIQKKDWIMIIIIFDETNETLNKGNENTTQVL